MKKNPFDQNEYLRSRLDRYEVDVPEFGMKRNRTDRWVHYLASPTKNPFDPLVNTMRMWTLAKVIAVVLSAGGACLQALLML
ncbi:hypothetical protein [Halobacillus salinus]|uniref:Uncharacterized protein n=1 Tax=Halobacillus salinus TaxID=192814 RepID=A0A4Z0H0H9_9BACI|nr:hypothetical protein [Halobacillus salinus]TGB03620.1 hypothetical protein E4663_01025 [Halobacillus salinus]